MANQPSPVSLPRSRAALDLPPLVVPTMSLQLPQMSEKCTAPTIIITPSSPSSELDFHILHVPSPSPRPWSARLRLPWSRSWSSRGPIALESPPLDSVQNTPDNRESSWCLGRFRLRTLMVLAVPFVVVATHVIIARSYGFPLSLDLGDHPSNSDWFSAGHGPEMHSEA
ncbi:Transmembrane protein [Ceratobasidium theobromae]|uniref:Transmembrane protein n=1 Tax=Ceratobasidium theobromae TaxID=1582974 RepID=A0A5N5QUI6_9AGAM|nr:Transmembrane protein [Ceratobasidium theobromae]